MKTTVLGLYNVMSGGAFADATVFALSIQPYINASIIIQLLTVAIPALERMAREEGEEGRKKIASITRYTTVGIGLIQGFAYYMLMRNQYNILTNDSIAAAFVIIVTFVAGSAFIMWLGEQITEFGIGNGICLPPSFPASPPVSARCTATARCWACLVSWAFWWVCWR